MAKGINGSREIDRFVYIVYRKGLTNKIDIKEVIRIFAQTERRIILEWTNLKQKYQLIYINTQFYRNKCSCIML